MFSIFREQANNLELTKKRQKQIPNLHLHIVTAAAAANE